MFLKKYFTRKNFLIFSAIIAAGLSFLLAKQVLAVDGDALASLLLMLTGWLAEILIYVFGQLLLIAISILIKVASFNDFVNADIVTIGWVIMRDVANLGIVVVMLIMAFGTTLNKNQYHYKTLLPKLILAAILVNFSKSITGVLIDASQLLMMTFVHAFESIAAGNITYGLGIEDMLSVRSAAKAGGAATEINDWNVMGALILGVVMLAVGLGVVVSLAIMFLYRIIVLWLLIIFSPIAFVGNLLPGAAQYVGQWRSMLTNYLVKGPTLAFMFWLSMMVLSQITESNRLINLQMQSQQAAFGVTSSAVNYAYFASKISSPQRVFDYLVTVVLFIFTMKTAAASGVLGASVAGSVMGKLTGVGRWIQKRPGVIGRKMAGAGWRATTIPQRTEAMVGRLARTKGLRWAGLTKEVREEKEILRRGKAQAAKVFGGGMLAARRAAEDAVARKRAEIERAQGYLDTEGVAVKRVGDLIKKGKELEAKGMMYDMAKEGWVSRILLSDYRNKFGTTNPNEKEKFNETAIFEEKIQTLQKAEGGKFNMHLADFKYDDVLKEYVYLSSAKKGENVVKQTKDMTRSELSSAVTAKSVTPVLDADTGEATNPLLGHFLKGIYERGDVLGQDIREKSKRDLLAKAVEEIAVNPTKFGLKPEDINEEGVLAEVYKRLTANKYNVDGSVLEGGKNLKEILPEATERVNKKYFKARTKVLKAGAEKLTALDQAFIDQVVSQKWRDGDMKEALDNAEEAKVQISQGMYKKAKGQLMDFYSILVREALKQASVGIDTGHMHPETGEKLDSIGLLQNSTIGKAYDQAVKILSKDTLIEDDNDHLDYLMSSIIYPLERSSPELNKKNKEQLLELENITKTNLDRAIGNIVGAIGITSVAEIRKQMIQALDLVESVVKENRKSNPDQSFVKQLTNAGAELEIIVKGKEPPNNESLRRVQALLETNRDYYRST